MSWNYAELSKAAKEAGGPEALMDVLVDSGRKSGRKDMAPLVLIALAAGAGIMKAIDYFTEKKKESTKKVEAAKEELIQGIKDYDEKSVKNKEAHELKEMIKDDKKGGTDDDIHNE